jgi:RimJ/RimL family protein N-acetyltransferase
MIRRLENKHLVLERYTKNDNEALFQAIKASSKEISPWLSWLTPAYDLKAAEDFIDIQINNWDEDLEYTYAIKNHQGDFLGTIGLHVYDTQNDVASIGYWMNTSHTSKGYCSQAVKLLVENAFKQLNLIRIEVIVAVENHASQRVAEKAGAQFEAELKNRIRLRGFPIDAKMYAFI